MPISLGLVVDAIADAPIPRDVQFGLDHGARGFVDLDDPAELHARLHVLFESIRAQHPELGIHGLRADLAYFVAPAYPAPAGLELRRIAIVAEIGEGGAFRTMLGPFDPAHVDPHPIGVDARGAQLAVYRDRALDVVATLPDGTAWLVARRRRSHE